MRQNQYRRDVPQLNVHSLSTLSISRFFGVIYRHSKSQKRVNQKTGQGIRQGRKDYWRDEIARNFANRYPAPTWRFSKYQTPHPTTGLVREQTKGRLKAVVIRLPGSEGESGKRLRFAASTEGVTGKGKRNKAGRSRLRFERRIKT